MPEVCRHVRRIKPQPVRGHWQLRCDCGWASQVRDAFPTAEAREKTLAAVWLAHVPVDERRTYVLVDQRQVPKPGAEEDDDELLPRGNWIMPEGVAVNIVSWAERDDGFYWARVHEWTPLAPVLELPIGEVRLANGRVFRAD